MRNCGKKGWHQVQSESMIDPSKIQLLAATGHLSRCVRALDSDGTIDPDIEDIVAKHPGNEKIVDSRNPAQHDPMAEQDWEKLLQNPRCNIDLQPLARRISDQDWNGTPKRHIAELHQHPALHGLVRIIYKIATAQVPNNPGNQATAVI